VISVGFHSAGDYFSSNVTVTWVPVLEVWAMTLIFLSLADFSKECWFTLPIWILFFDKVPLLQLLVADS
jgi:hypothetical protein